MDLQSASEVNLNSNVDARIRNPLAGIPHDQLLLDVEEFAREKELLDILPFLSKGAVLAQNPAEYLTLKELDPADREIIGHEYTHRWSHPWPLYMTIILCSVGAATQSVFSPFAAAHIDRVTQRVGPDRVQRSQHVITFTF